ncbi:hypothetical protein BDQ94DRAFT_160463 [Aspergillus welwitschiae]|uniref:Uncharacterized protein n=1 Tax=Aspergillus welwitschiae TaxID=1341132 RepID=A0A3F3PXW2_9EURO|nr:hypothetical protein BDQ94DRAFT_160463 [Aspergillus welwitschiae]RDH31804.1 hypothetical protein BDQ94DRAFT_160463 [Aspergillus welwitschiae]
MRGIRSRQVVQKRTLPNQSTMEMGCQPADTSGRRDQPSAGAVRISGAMRSTGPGGGDILFSRWIHHIPWTQAALEGFVRRTISVCDFDSSSSVVSLERCGHSTIQMLSSVTP